MCCFSEEVERVSDTNIFVRSQGGRQLVVYSMAYAARGELAMVLPIPALPGSDEAAVRFMSLAECPHFFAEMAAGFRPPDGDDIGGLLSGAEVEVPAGRRTLQVQEIGSYEASFVPSPEDFGRLDKRFRLPVEIWLELGNYRDWGFAVFKLRETALARVHPMAFEFPRRDQERLFLPTLHVHHRRLERAADFDHTLYCQVEPAMNWHLAEWEDSFHEASSFVSCAQALELLDPAEACWRARIEGQRENRDTWIGKGESLPDLARA